MFLLYFCIHVLGAYEVLILSVEIDTQILFLFTTIDEDVHLIGEKEMHDKR